MNGSADFTHDLPFLALLGLCLKEYLHRSVQCLMFISLFISNLAPHISILTLLVGREGAGEACISLSSFCYHMT